MASQLVLNWTLEPAHPGQLLLRYQVENPATQTVWLLDLPLVFDDEAGAKADPQALQVRASASTARLVRGYLAPSGLPQVELMPAARELAPGASLTGSAVVALPLQSWHPNDLARHPIDAQTATLEVGYLESAESLQPLALADGSTVRVPTLAAALGQRLVRGEPQPLPLE